LLKKVEDRLRPIHSPPIPGANVRDAVIGQAEYFRITRDAMVAIGINRVPTASSSNRHPLVYSRLRDIEAPMLGACYLTEWTEGLEALYDLGAEIETYRTADELSEKLGELRKDLQRRRAMRDRAQRRALIDHSASRSLARISARLGLSAEP
jgi:spore maturation protein CgeB